MLLIAINLANERHGYADAMHFQIAFTLLRKGWWNPKPANSPARRTHVFGNRKLALHNPKGGVRMQGRHIPLT